MKKRIHPATGVLVIAIVLVLVMMVGRKRMEVLSPTPTARIVAIPQGPPMEEPALGITWQVDQREGGIRVANLLPSPPPSRLALLGVRPADLLAEVNGEECTFKNLEESLNELTYRGKPFTLTVIRGGQQVKIEAKQLPAALKRMKF